MGDMHGFMSTRFINIYSSMYSSYLLSILPLQKRTKNYTIDCIHLAFKREVMYRD